MAYTELFFAALNPSSCNTDAAVPARNISSNDPPNASTQMIDAQMNANKQRRYVEYMGRARRMHSIRSSTPSTAGLFGGFAM